MKKLLKIFTLSGEASRKEWWCVYIGFWALLFVSAQIDTLLNGGNEESGTFFTIILVVSIWPLLATQIRRWHDRGKSGFWCLINFLPVIGNLWALIELGFLPAKEDNPWAN